MFFLDKWPQTSKTIVLSPIHWIGLMGQFHGIVYMKALILMVKTILVSYSFIMF